VNLEIEAHEGELKTLRKFYNTFYGVDWFQVYEKTPSAVGPEY
jgi:hypothetical protein